MVPDTLLIIGLALLFLTTVVLGAAEAALIRVPRAQVAVAAERGVRASRRLLRLIDDLPVALNTILLVVLLAQIGAATVAGVLADRYFGGVGITIASVGLTLILFVYSEAIPKTIAVRNPMATARMLVPVVGTLVRLLRPVTRLLVAFADLQMPGRTVGTTSGITEEELRYLAGEAATSGAIEPSDLDLIEKGFALGDMTVDDIMVPRTEVVSVPVDLTTREALDLALTEGHRRLPVREEDLDSVVGVVLLRDLAASVATTEPSTVRDLMSSPLFVPESKRVVETLREMQESHRHLAIVVDEHGGSAGIVTIEDVVAELVGEISHEGEPLHTMHRVVDDGVWQVDGRLELDDLEELVGSQLQRGEARTVAGFVLEIAGGIPSEGDTFSLDAIEIEVTRATDRRIETATIRRSPSTLET